MVEQFAMTQELARTRMTPHLLENYIPVPESGCWLWGGGWARHGYGNAHSLNHWHVAAHRLYYAYFVGDIPTGMCVCHKCDTRPCVNPDHLFLGSHQENAEDKCRKGRAGTRVGKRGPSLTAENAVAIYKAGGTHAAIATKYGVGKSTVGMIKAGRNWANATKHLRSEP